MARETERAARRRMAALLAAVPVAYTCSLIAQGAVDVPYTDDWFFVPTLQRAVEGRLTLPDLWAQHYEHRLFFPRLVWLALARVSGWDLRVGMAANLVLALLTLVVLVRQGRAAAAALGATLPPWTGALLAAIVLSFTQWQNFLWHWQLQIFLCVLACVGGLAALSADGLRPRHLAAAGALGVVATFSFTAGVVFWPLALLLALPSHPADRVDRRARLACLGAMTLLAAALYLHGFALPPKGDWEGEFSLAAVPAGIMAALGAPVSPMATVPADTPGRLPWPVDAAAAAIALGALGAAAFLALAVRRLREVDPAGRRQVAFWVAVGGLGLASAVMCGLGRVSKFGLEYALQPRYVTLTTPLWAALAALSLLPHAGASARERRAGVCLAALIAGLCALGTVLAAPIAAPWARARALTAQRLVEADPQPLERLAPPLSPAESSELVARLRALHLSFFRRAPARAR